MDLSKIVKPAEDELVAKEAAAQAEREAKAAGEAALLKLHAQKTEEKFATVVKPVLVEAMSQLSGLGYTGRVAETVTEEPKAGLARVVTGLMLSFVGKRIQSPSNREGVFELEYDADLAKFVVTAVERLHGGGQVLQDGHQVPIADVTKELVERHVEGFVTRAMKREAGEF